ncbi:hypothetical protein WL12_16795 [Burkholderia ubonensis]|nr:hypothetical protein WL12_16795 [Burkholderia ubonensis]
MPIDAEGVSIRTGRPGANTESSFPLSSFMLPTISDTGSSAVADSMRLLSFRRSIDVSPTTKMSWLRGPVSTVSPGLIWESMVAGLPLILQAPSTLYID